MSPSTHLKRPCSESNDFHCCSVEKLYKCGTNFSSSTFISKRFLNFEFEIHPYPHSFLPNSEP
uniref:Putative ovule protein n=1 Tax=Solanum chacoense TaxID=4108 RepID=A0A0V0GQ18_SOLCH